MKPTLVKLEIIELPEIVIVGKRVPSNYIDIENGKNNISKFWKECSEDGTFTTLEKFTDFIYNPARVGYIKQPKDFHYAIGNFNYICGMMMKSSEVPVPENFVRHRLEATKVAVGSVKGVKDNDTAEFWKTAYVHMTKEADKKGVKLNDDCWGMEVHNGSRSATPKDEENIIVDFYYPCE